MLWRGVNEREEVCAAIEDKLTLTLPNMKEPYEQELAGLEAELAQLKEKEQQKVRFAAL